MNLPQLQKLLRSYYFDIVTNTDACILYDEDHEELLANTADHGHRRLDLALTMLNTMLEWFDDPCFCNRDLPEDTKHMGKVNRWLGFVQGVLWSEHMRTVNQMREDNRPIFD